MRNPQFCVLVSDKRPIAGYIDPSPWRYMFPLGPNLCENSLFLQLMNFRFLSLLNTGLTQVFNIIVRSLPRSVYRDKSISKLLVTYRLK